MPTLLRYDAIRLFEASVEALHIATANLGITKRTDYKQPVSEFAIELGLIGVAAEQAMSACIIQAKGPDAILQSSGYYKTATALLGDFKTLVTESTASSSFLTEGVPDPAGHRTALLESIKPFKLLMTMRAMGLHGGKGLLHETVVVQANLVANFLEQLARSRRVGPYLQKIPRCLWYARDRVVLVEDLKARLAAAKGAEKLTALASIYLVLPDIPDTEPDWLQPLERIAVAPKGRDVKFLLETLENAVPAALRRATAGRGAIHARIAPDDPEALPIAPQFLRRQFSEISELWFADIATANGRLEQGSIDLPPADAVLDVYALGLGRADILEEGRSLSAHEAWPHIIASIAQQRTTAGPYWFLVRRCGDLGQLASLIRLVGRVKPTLRSKLEECLKGINALRNDQQIARTDLSFQRLISDSTTTRDKSGLVGRQERQHGSMRALPDSLIETLEAVADGGEPVGKLLKELLECEEASNTCKAYWSWVLAGLASEADDVPALVILLHTAELQSAHTDARKALRRIDFSINGPPIAEGVL